MKNYTLEVCVDSVESALAAVRGGADRLELCSNLIIGGTSPGKWLFHEIRKVSNIKMHVLVRPRYGDFCYSDYEFRIMEDEIRMFREMKADAIVIGCLKPDGHLDDARMERLMSAGRGMHVTLHRAFDLCQYPLKALKEAKALGIDTILTSGQKNNCLEGKELIRQLVKESEGQIDIMIGGGVKAAIIEELYRETHAVSYHMSGKKRVESSMLYKNEEVSMGHPSFDEYTLWQTDERRVMKARQVLEGLTDRR